MLRRVAAFCLFLVEIAGVVRARYVPTRWFSWAPNDYAVGYSLQVLLNGEALTPEQIGKRYNVSPSGVYENPVENLIEILTERERTYGRTDGAEVVLTYRPNGETPKEWKWPKK
jgi:hypothetical protein